MGKIAAVDTRSDVFSLGAILYSLLTGTMPFVGRTVHEPLRNTVAGKVRPPREVLSIDLPQELCRITARAVACALDMQLAMESVNRWNREHDLPAIHMGVGIHAGEVVVGNIGSRKRSKYAVVGAPVNLAAVQDLTSSAAEISILAATPPMSRRGPSLLHSKSGGSNSPMVARSSWE